jgi:hypothetical protein
VCVFLYLFHIYVSIYRVELLSQPCALGAGLSEKRLSRVVRRVEPRKAGAQLLVLSERHAQPRLHYVELISKAQHRSPRVLGPCGPAVGDAAEEEAAREQRQLLAPRHAPQGLLQHGRHGFCGKYTRRLRHSVGLPSQLEGPTQEWLHFIGAVAEDEEAQRITFAVPPLPAGRYTERLEIYDACGLTASLSASAEDDQQLRSDLTLSVLHTAPPGKQDLFHGVMRSFVFKI